ncbi:MAG: hypothetical protein ACD_11C00116G0019 [uncultured bacterium]|nr:MAG: hypothetical protein ACD_11C00116G0019 [uncultured bacterium]HBR71236.1 hypothetical protein [Candidatus Moranbacteria bacterium]
MKDYLPQITKYLFLLTVLLLPSYLIRFSFFGLPTNVLEVLAGISILLLFLEKKQLLFLDWKNICHQFRFPLVLLFLGLLLSFFANKFSLDSLGIIKGWFVAPFLFSISLPLIFKEEKDVRKLLEWLYFSISWVAIVSLGYKFFNIVTYDGRLTSFYLSPNHLAMYLAPGFFIGTYLIKNPVNKKYLFFLSALLIFIASAFYFTFSYGAWLSVFLSFALLFFIGKDFILKKNVLVLSALILFVFFVFQINNPKLSFLDNPRSSLSSRMMIWDSGLKIIKDNPFFGIGPGNFQNKYLEYQKFFLPYLEWAVPQPHNIYLAFWLQAGILGLLGFLILCSHWIYLQIKQKNAAETTVFLGIFLYILLHGLIDTPYWKNDLAFVFWITFFLSPRKFKTSDTKAIAGDTVFRRFC